MSHWDQSKSEHLITVLLDVFNDLILKNEHIKQSSKDK